MGASKNYVFDRRTSIFSSLEGFGPSLLGMQKSLTEPDIPELTTGTDLLNPSVTTRTRLAHFPDELFDKSDGSVFIRFMKAMLGDAGAGQLRKRLLVQRMWSILASTHFYDLDRFYGAIFGVSRRPGELLPINPLTELATPDGWDEISTFDARYRERIMQLAKAITLGGTPAGMKAISEALTGVECDVYEIWQMLDTAGSLGYGRTWQQAATTYINYANLATTTWGEVENRPSFGSMGDNVRNEFVIRPKKIYEDDDAGKVDRAYDFNGIRRVLEHLMPANTLLSIDDKGVAVRMHAPIANIAADSEFWDVVPRVIPDSEKETLYENTRRAYDARHNPEGYQYVKPAEGKTPFQGFLGQAWSMVPSIKHVEAWWQENRPGLQWQVVGRLQDWRRDGFAGVGNHDIQVIKGKRVTYGANRAHVDPAAAIAGNVAGDGVLVASPYSGTRVAIGS